MNIDIMSLIPAQLVILIVFIYCLGMFLKKTNKFPDWLIPITLLIASIIVTIAYTAISLGAGLSGKIIVDGIIYGVLVASVAVYCNQVIKQILERNNE